MDYLYQNQKTVLFFRKKRPFLADLIPEGQTDIHSHVLPGIDDGAGEISDSLELIRSLQKIGYRKLVATPHIMYGVWDNDRPRIETALENVRTALAENNIDITVASAAEYMLDSNFPHLLAKGDMLTLKDNYILIEMSYLNPPLYLHQVIFDIHLAGFVPILAHPERYGFYHKNYGELKKIKDSGCKFQVNLLSIVGYYGPQVAETAKRLLQEGLIDFAGSDVHHANHIKSFERRVVLKDTAPVKHALENTMIFS